MPLLFECEEYILMDQKTSSTPCCAGGSLTDLTGQLSYHVCNVAIRPGTSGLSAACAGDPSNTVRLEPGQDRSAAVCVTF